MTVIQLEKANRFCALHQEPGFFVIANAWDPGSARILAGLGFQARRPRAVRRQGCSVAATAW